MLNPFNFLKININVSVVDAKVGDVNTIILINFKIILLFLIFL